MRSLIRKKLIVCVRPGEELVRANPREFVSTLIKLDLPMFERPQNAISARWSWGKSSGCFALLTNRAERTLTIYSATEGRATQSMQPGNILARRRFQFHRSFCQSVDAVSDRASFVSIRDISTLRGKTRVGTPRLQSHQFMTDPG